MKLIQPAQHGFAVVTALFLIVILAALGAFMVTFSNTQHLTSAQDMQGSRAYWAARAGLEWGIGSVVASTSKPPACPIVSTSLPGSTSESSTTPLSTLFDGGFSVTVQCSVQRYQGVGKAGNIFQFLSVAKIASSSAGNLGYVERSLSASMEQ